jgi:hypothetical protein
MVIAGLKLIAATAEKAALKLEQGKFWEGELSTEVNRIAAEAQALQREIHKPR